MPIGSVLLPLLAGLVFAFAAMAVKRGLAENVSLATMTLLSNIALGLTAMPFALFGGGDLLPTPLWPALVYGVLVAIGNGLVYLALVRGDVSVATPLLGSKVVLVACLAALVLGQQLSLGTWAAVALCVVGLLCLRPSGRVARASMSVTIAASLAAALLFAICDLILQDWAAPLGILSIIPSALMFAALVSLPLVPICLRDVRHSPGGFRAALLASGLNSVQGLLLAGAIALYYDATTTNIIYSTRGVWSVILVVVVGHWFNSSEQRLARSVLGLRVVGAALIVGAVVLARP
jgi:drug/metabolite transporter (DMT)-like permease